MERTKQEAHVKLRVVIADDEPVICMALREMLENLGYEVVAEAEDGFQAMGACKQFQPDVVLLDVKMPVLDGLAAAHYISEQQLADTIILVTAYHDMALVEKANKSGVAGYLVKPVNENELMPCIEVARARSKEIQRLKGEVARAERALQTRKLIERAKGLLVDEKQFSEQEAYNYIRTISKEQCISLETVAVMILRAAGRDV